MYRLHTGYIQITYNLHTEYIQFTNSTYTTYTTFSLQNIINAFNPITYWCDNIAHWIAIT